MSRLGRSWRHRGLRALAAAAAALLVASGCTAPQPRQPVQVIDTSDGVGIDAKNVQQSKVWTVAGFIACTRDALAPVKFGRARLTKGSGEATVRAGVDVTGQATGTVDAIPLPTAYLPVGQVTSLPSTGCPPKNAIKFAFEVTSTQGWQASGFELDYTVGGTAYTASWKFNAKVCGVSGCA